MELLGACGELAVVEDDRLINVDEVMTTVAWPGIDYSTTTYYGKDKP